MHHACVYLHKRLFIVRCTNISHSSESPQCQELHVFDFKPLGRQTLRYNNIVTLPSACSHSLWYSCNAVYLSAWVAFLSFNAHSVFCWGEARGRSDAKSECCTGFYCFDYSAAKATSNRKTEAHQCFHFHSHDNLLNDVLHIWNRMRSNLHCVADSFGNCTWRGSLRILLFGLTISTELYALLLFSAWNSRLSEWCVKFLYGCEWFFYHQERKIG